MAKRELKLRLGRGLLVVKTRWGRTSGTMSIPLNREQVIQLVNTLLPPYDPADPGSPIRVTAHSKAQERLMNKLLDSK